MNDKKENGQEVLLLEKGKRGLLRMLFGRTGIILLLLIVQILIIFSMFQYLARFIPYVFGGFVVFTVLMVLNVINKDYDPTVKLTWIILITLLPAFGSCLYIFINMDFGHRALKKRLQDILQVSVQSMPKQNELMEKLKKKQRALYNLAHYTVREGDFPIYEHSEVAYFSSGEDKFKVMLEELQKAEKYIFLEYFIIDEGYMWGSILNILAQKAKEGVDVRVMYDGMCEFELLPHSYPKKLKELGIWCKIFSSISPFVSTHYNYRDHRKILVIDGKVAFTGGVNLADEYINQKKLHGHWKDTAVMVKGEAVKSFIRLFLEMWNITDEQVQYEPYMAEVEPVKNAKGYVLPYGVCPLTGERVGEMVYIDILNRAKKYVHIMTPYLILDGTMSAAIQFAARRGVEVCIMLPHIPDKKYAFALAHTHYKELIKAGVKIYEYTPGFIHAKVVDSDGKRAVVGTINFDYRSLYHHFECGLFMEEVPAIVDIEKDMQDTMKQSQLITMEDLKHGNLLLKMAGRMLKFMAPLM